MPLSAVLGVGNQDPRVQTTALMLTDFVTQGISIICTVEVVRAPPSGGLGGSGASTCGKRSAPCTAAVRGPGRDPCCPSPGPTRLSGSDL